MMRVRLEFLNVPVGPALHGWAAALAPTPTSTDGVRKIVGHRLFPYALQPVNDLWRNDPDEGGWYSLKNGYFMDDPTNSSRLLFLGRLYALIDTFSAQALKLWAQYVWEWRWTRHFDSEYQRTIVNYIGDYTAVTYERKTGLPGWWVYNDCSLKNCETVAFLEGT